MRQKLVPSLILLHLGRRFEIAKMVLAEEQNLKHSEDRGDMMEWSVNACPSPGLLAAS